MKREEVYFRGSNKNHIRYGCIFLPDNEPYNGIIQISHGMCEHIGRYERFARYMTERGYIVCGNDHEGHGKSSSYKDLGHIQGKFGYKNLVKDLYIFNKIVKRRYPDLPLVLLGHSMGSFVARMYLCKYGKTIDKLILSGTRASRIFAYFGIFFFSISSILFSDDIKSKKPMMFVDFVFNFFVRHKKTSWDWLTRDDNIVREFIRDKRCGQYFTYGGYVNLLKLVVKCNSDKCLKNSPENIPVLFISGTQDPVGVFGIDIRVLCSRFRVYGNKKVSSYLYKGGRHEMLNELNRNSVYEDIYFWLK